MLESLGQTSLISRSNFHPVASLINRIWTLSLGKLSPVEIYIAISNNIIVVVNCTISVSLGIQKSASCDDAKFTSLTNLLYAQVTDIDKS